ncbi:putative X8 domain-containing protein [Helianthus annuus]|nr:putative X8 domain-containing protein [Helianthus annuus]
MVGKVDEPMAATPMAIEELWCVAKLSVPLEKLQVALDYVCGAGGADCGPIKPNGSCYSPDSKNKKNGGICGFEGTAMLISSDLSKITITIIVTVTVTAMLISFDPSKIIFVVTVTITIIITFTVIITINAMLIRFNRSKITIVVTVTVISTVTVTIIVTAMFITFDPSKVTVVVTVTVTIIGTAMLSSSDTCFLHCRFILA